MANYRKVWMLKSGTHWFVGASNSSDREAHSAKLPDRLEIAHDVNSPS